jgi:cytochrome c oxidase assembly protein subunit 11
VDKTEFQTANTRLIAKLSSLVVGMFAFGFALVPLYDVFCDLTGLNGKTGPIVEAAAIAGQQVDRSRTVTVEFVATLNQSMDWEFRPTEGELQIHPGKLYTTNFYARNKAQQSMVGQAVPSVAPGLAAVHFKKTECFCFQRQLFKAGEARKMPVSFLVDTDLPPGVETITLSYTFFDVTDTAALSQAGGNDS